MYKDLEIRTMDSGNRYLRFILLPLERRHFHSSIGSPFLSIGKTFIGGSLHSFIEAIVTTAS